MFLDCRGRTDLSHMKKYIPVSSSVSSFPFLMCSSWVGIVVLAIGF